MSELGVVDPLVVPGLQTARGGWARIPTLGRLFVGLAILDVALRAAGIGSPLFFDIAFPLGIVSTFLPHDGLILLPAIVLARTPELRRRSPAMWLGVLVVAIVEFLRRPVEQVTGGGEDPFVLISAVGVATGLGLTIGWILVARALRTTPAFPSATWSAGLANLAALVIAVVAVVSNLGSFFALEEPGPEESQLPLLYLNAIGSIVSGLASAYLARALLRGVRDPRRPPHARGLATAAALLMVVGSLLQLFGVVIYFGTVPVPGSNSPLDPFWWTVLFWLTGPFATIVLIGAFVFGLAEGTSQGTSEPATIRA